MALNVSYIKSGLKINLLLDIGAFVGDSAIILSELTDDKVYSFEPVRENYELMLKTIELNNLERVIPLNMGVGAENCLVPLYSAGSSSAADKLMAVGSQSEAQCEIVKIDDFVDRNNLSVGLIKVDIEGYEQKFLEGANHTIQTQRPTLLLSIYHNVDDFLDIKSIIENMNAGYKFKIFKPVDGMVSTEVLLICESPK